MMQVDHLAARPFGTESLSSEVGHFLRFGGSPCEPVELQTGFSIGQTTAQAHGACQYVASASSISAFQQKDISMISRSMTDLGILRSREPHPSLEVQASGLEEHGIDLQETAATALRKLAETDPKLIATVYLFGTISTNFHEREPSEFLIPVGTERNVQRVLEAMNAGVTRLGPGVKSRMSDHVRPSDGVPFLHIEGGKVWEPEDAVTWFTHTDDPAPASELSHEASPSPSTQPAEAEADWLDDSDDKELPDMDDPSAHTRLAKPLRVRRARSDASVGSIKSNIEQVFGLPEGSVALCGPDGKALRSDALIKTLRARWE